MSGALLLALLVLLATGSRSAADVDEPSAGASRAELVRIGFPRDDGSLTPYTFDIGYPLVTLVYDTLAGGGGLARRITRSDKGRRITIRLHKNVRWHDGRRLTAADVAFTFDYVKRHFHPRFTPQLEAVVRVRAKDDLTAVVTLRHASPGFTALPLSDLPIIPEHIWQRLPARQFAPAGLPVGSGPYRMIEYSPKKRYRFRANRRYFLGRPRVERIDVPFIGDFDRMVRELQSRDIDMISATLPERTQDRLRTSVFKTKFGPLYNGTVLMFNLRKAPFDDSATRQAVAAALDIQRIARNEIIGGRDAVAAIRGYLHPHSGWAASAPIHRFQPARARADLARLLRRPIRLLVQNNDPVKLEAAREVGLALRRVGVQALVQRVSVRRLATAIGQGGARPTFEAAILTSPSLPSKDPDFMRAIFGPRGAPLNFTGYRSAAFDKLAVQTARETNDDRRRASVREQLGLLARDVPLVPLFFQEGAFVYNPQTYAGWLYAPGAGILTKRSFLPRQLVPVAGPAAAPPPPGPTSGGGGIGVAGYVAFALLGGVAIYIAGGYVTRRRRR